MDCLDLAEKAVKKKAPAAEMEQPEKEVKNSKSKFGNSFVRAYITAKLKSKLSGIASVLADYIYTHNGDDFNFLQWHARQETSLSSDLIKKAKKELEDKNIIKIDIIREQGRFAGERTPFNYDLKTWTTGTGKTGKGKTRDGKTGDGKTSDGKTGDGKTGAGKKAGINIYIDKQAQEAKETKSAGNINEGELEGAAAKPQPAPALSEGAENVPEKSAAQNAPGAASQESSFPETAQGQKSEKSQIPLTVPEVMKQGQTDLFGEAAPLPEKPKKDRKAKPFTPPTKEEVRLELESLLAKKGTIQQWSDNDLRAMTEKFFEHYNTRNWEKSNGQKLKDWRASLNTTWLLKQGYLPDRTTRNQPQREGKQIFTAEQLEKLAAGSTDPQRALEQRREQEIQKGGVIIQN